MRMNSKLWFGAALWALLVAAVLVACAHLTPAQKQELEDVGVSAGTVCVGGPALSCIWDGGGWEAYRDCVWARALPCAGEHLAALIPTLVDLGRSAGRMQLEAAVVDGTYLAQADACKQSLPEPTIGMCGDVPLTDCGARQMARCIDEALEAAVAAAGEPLPAGPPLPDAGPAGGPEE